MYWFRENVFWYLLFGIIHRVFTVLHSWQVLLLFHALLSSSNLVELSCNSCWLCCNLQRLPVIPLLIAREVSHWEQALCFMPYEIGRRRTSPR